MSREVWIDAHEFEGFYEVSNLGRVRNIRDGYILASALDGGRPVLTLCKNGERLNRRLHVLVLSSFCGPRPFEGAHAAHNDGNSENCILSNLRWATPVENQADRERHGTKIEGEAVFGAKLKVAEVSKIKALLTSGMRSPDIAKLFGVSTSTIHLIKKNRIWRG